MPSHSHSLETPEGIWNWGGDPVYGTRNNGLGFSGDYMYHDTTPHTNSVGGGQPVEILPPYYALCFIMKMGN